nr:MAG TPA: hypothetical protein [Bacteriophage sp.]
MNILEALMGEKYSKFESTVYADGGKVVVTVSRTLSPTNVDLDSPGYVENKFKKLVPILTSIGVMKNKETGEQTINVTVGINGRFNSVANLNHLANIASAISELVEDKLSEPEIIKNIGLDCKSFLRLRNESEEAQADA